MIGEKKIRIMSATLTCRLALPEDQDEIVRTFEDIYNGRDYLPAFYKHYMSHPERFKCFVGILDGHIVTFGMFQVLEGGKVLYFMAGRTRSDLRSSGLFDQMSRFRHQYIRMNYPEACFMSLTSHLNFILRKPTPGVDRKLLATGHSLAFRVPTSGAFLQSVSKQVCSLHHTAFADDISTRFAVVTSPRSHQICISNFLVLFFEPFSLIEGREDIIHCLSHDCVNVSYTLATNAPPQHVDSTAVSRNISHFATSRVFKSPGGVSLYLDTFACEAPEIWQHLCAHLDRNERKLLEEENIIIVITNVLVQPLMMFLQSFIDGPRVQFLSKHQPTQYMVLREDDNTVGTGVIGQSKL